MYASVADLRAEGVGEVSDQRLDALIDEATRTIDKVTRQFFEPRHAAFRLDARGMPTIELPVPPYRTSPHRMKNSASRLTRFGTVSHTAGHPRWKAAVPTCVACTPRP